MSGKVGARIGLRLCVPLLLLASPGSAGSQDGLPNLRPVRPDGWSDSLLVSNRQETHTDNLRLMAYDRLFVDFAVINSGGSPAAAPFRIELFLNGRLRETFDVAPPLDPQVYRFREDYPLGRLSSGTHTLRVVVDGGEAVPESDESDNQYTKTFFVSGACFPLTTRVSPRGAGTVIPGREPNCGSATLGVRTPGADDRESNRELGMGGEPVLQARRDRAFDALRAKVRAEGQARVIVGLRTDGQSVSAAVSSLNEAQARSPLISRVQQSLLTRMGSYSLSSVRRFKYMPHLAMEVDGPALEALASDPEVITLEEDVRVEPSLETSTALVGAPNAWSQGYSGAGQAVAILDTGVDGEHPFLKDRVVSEACYSGGGEGSAPLCPGGVRESIGMESGEPCSSASDCFHGTAVAGVAAGAGTTFSGVAPDSGIVAIKVFSRCRGPVDCLTSTTSDWVAGLERVLELSGGYDIAAVNMSFGGGLSSEECDAEFPAAKAAMDNLRAFGIAPVAASGNNRSSTGIQFPSCISSAISVGSTDTGADETIPDEVSVFSNNSPLVDLLAPGGGINTSVPGDGFARFDGTSLAVPHVAGAWAVLKSKAPNASVPDLLSALKSNGVPVLDPRNNLIKPRIQVDAALDKIVRELPYSTGTRMTLTARPNPGFRFTGWQGCDSPSGNGCVVEMDSSRQVVALFEPTSAAHPDLVPTSLVTPPIAETGRPVSIYAAFSNPGPVDAGPFRIGFYLSVDDVITTIGVLVRTATAVPEGRAGLAYPGIDGDRGFHEAVYLCGLRQNTRDRSNVAFQNMGTTAEGTITLRTTVFSGDPEDTTVKDLGTVELGPGEFHQFSPVLRTLANGYVRVERVDGRAPFYAYGVINDQANSDGSFVFPVAAGSLEGSLRHTLPVIVEINEFSSELTVTNFSEEEKTLHFDFVAEGLTTADRTARFRLRLEPGRQRIIPDVIDTEMRRKGIEGVPAGRGGLAGALFATVESGDMNGIVIGARTSSSDGRGGQYGVFYNAVPDGAAFTGSVWIDALQQNQENRSNLALVNTGEVDDSPSVFEIDIYDGATGMLVETVTMDNVGPADAGGLRLAARRWHQFNGILSKYARGTTQGYVRVRRISGNNPFLAYGVVNDGGAPGQRSGDGAYVPARR